MGQQNTKATANVTLNISAKMDNLEAQLKKYRDLLDNVKPDTSSYKTLSKELTKLERGFLNIKRDSQEAFSSESQIKSFENRLKKLGYSAEDLSDNFKSIKFSDLLFNDGDLDKLEAMRSELTKLQDKLKSFEKEAVRDFVRIGDTNNNDFFKNILKINPEKVSKDFDGFADLLIQKKKGLESQLAKSKGVASKKTQDFDSLNDLYVNLEKEAASLFDPTNSAFYNSKGGFKGGGKINFIESLMNFDIDPAFLESLKTKTLTEIMTFKDQIESAVQAKLDSVSVQKETARAPMETAKQTVSEIEKYLTQLETIMNSFDNFSTTQKASVELNNLQSSVKQTRVAIAQEMSKLFNTTMPKQQLDDLSNDVKTTMSEMVDDTRAANAALSNMSNLNATSDSIKGAIKDWFGFFEVINMGKRILSGMGNDIRELDKVITEITIVTDMGHNELWGSISTYSDIAKQYGSTIAGVYEVSMLYYQQGLDTNEVMAATEETLKMARIAGIDYATATDYELKSYVA